MDVAGHGVEKYANGRLFASSSGRGWRDLLAERRSHRKGELPSLRPRDTEIAIQLNGRTLVERQGGGVRERTYGTSGTIWLCPAGIREDFVNIHADISDCLHIYLPGEPFANTILANLGIDPSRAALRYKSVPGDSFIAEVSEKILMELTSETSSGRLLVESLSGALSAYLVSRYSEQALREHPSPKAASPLDEKRLVRVLEFIDSNLNREFRVSELSRVACMSASHLSRGFKAATGRTIHSFVSGRRLEMAKKLIAEGEKSLAEIAYETGFSSQANFVRAFKRVANSTPGQYRAKFTGRLILSESATRGESASFV